jgi:hypothetical protein
MPVTAKQKADAITDRDAAVGTPPSLGGEFTTVPKTEMVKKGTYYGVLNLHGGYIKFCLIDDGTNRWQYHQITVDAKDFPVLSAIDDTWVSVGLDFI